MKKRVIIDTGPLVALLNSRDQHHRWTADMWRGIEAPLLTCEAVIAEACHLLRKIDHGPALVMQLISRGAVSITFSLADEATSVARLIRKYSDRPISLANACLVRMAELNAGSEVMTVDSDFLIYRRRDRRVVPTLMPGN